MATYNGEKFLSKQLDSILNQKNVSVSILVRDDGSKDRTCNILNLYKSKGQLQWYAGPHLDVAKGYFDLMKKAEGYDVDYVAFSDQDDVWDLDKLYVASQFLDKGDPRKPLLYYCGQRLVDEQLNYITNHQLNRHRNPMTRFVLSDFAGCTGVFNLALLKEVIKYEPKYMLMHDTWILKVCLCLDGEIIVDPDPHINYRQHGKNAVGLEKSFRGYIKQVNQYLNEYHVAPQMEELLNGYKNSMISEYRELAECICKYKNSLSCKKVLLNKNNINFYNKGLNLTYALKVILNKL